MTPESPVTLWADSEFPNRGGEGQLTKDLIVDVSIVGAGIAGLTTAYLLARHGLSVAVLDAGVIATGESARTSAHLTSALDDRYYRLEQRHGIMGAALAAESHAAAIDFIEQVTTLHGIDCDFRRVDGYLFLHEGGSVDELYRESAAAARAGLTVDLVDTVPGLGAGGGPALRFARQAEFHPLRYLRGLADLAVQAGARIFTRTRAVAVTGGAVATVTTADGHHVSAGAALVATDVPVNDRLRMHPKLSPHRTYVIAAEIPVGAMPPALLWDTASPYHYVRTLKEDGTLFLVVGGADHPTGRGPLDAQAPYLELEAWMRQHFPLAGPVRWHWSGQIIETVDSLAYIGPNPGDGGNVHIITGDSGNGLTHGTLGGMLVADLIRGRPNRWSELYRPDRLSLRALGEFALNNAGVLGQYSDWMTTGDVVSADEIGPGSGAILRRGLTKVAAYRNENGVLHTCSATCPHLGGVVRWNAGEKTWDCPCLGSRFDALGRVLNGPATADLAVQDSEIDVSLQWSFQRE